MRPVAGRWRRPQNLPSTTGEYPNWRIPLAGREINPGVTRHLTGQGAHTETAGPWR
ncbi:MAG TPA: hypothetical protein VGS62_02110 [Streptosporangiaceae bacterium]|nr:hypothetical protein [Streptosporangiaceae bacterium]